MSYQPLTSWCICFYINCTCYWFIFSSASVNVCNLQIKQGPIIIKGVVARLRDGGATSDVLRRLWPEKVENIEKKAAHNVGKSNFAKVGVMQ